MTDDEIIEKIYNSMPLTAHAIKYATYVYGIKFNVRIYKSEIDELKFILHINSNNPVKDKRCCNIFIYNKLYEQMSSDKYAIKYVKRRDAAISESLLMSLPSVNLHDFEEVNKND